ncbi:MAG: ABC transporter ATP-binding protein, partial [Curtobacterium sp.]
THYLDEADTFADRIVIMRSGRVVADGTPTEIKAIASSRSVRFAGVGPDAHVALRALPGVTGLEARHDSVTLRTDRSDHTLRALLTAFPQAHDVQVVASTMDDAFLALTADPQEVSA